MIKFSKHNIKNSHLKEITKIIKSGWLTHGKNSKKFEEQFKKYTGSKYAITVSSCTAGLHLSCIASNFKKGDEVLVPSMSHTATSHAVEYTGARAVFVDVNFPDGNINVSQINKFINKKTKGIIVVHMAGKPVEIAKIKKICEKNKLVLIEDCAHSLGSRYNNKHVGNYGLSGSFSFYPTKQITTGEGGMVITNNKTFYKKILKLKAFGIDKDINDRKLPGKYNVKTLGYNYRMTDFQAYMGLRQLEDYTNNLKKRHKIAKRYIKNFENNKKIIFPDYDKNCSYFVFQIFVKNRNLILKQLVKKKIGVSVHYMMPLHKMGYYKKKNKSKNKHLKNSSAYGNMNLSLPVYPKLKISEVDYICDSIKKLI